MILGFSMVAVAQLNILIYYVASMRALNGGQLRRRFMAVYVV